MTPTPPGPRGLPLLGSLPAMARDPLAFLTHTAREYGDVSTFRLGGLRFFLIAHPDGVEEVLLGRSKDLMKDLFTRDLSALLGQGLLTSEGELWKRQRRLAAPSFQRATIARYAAAMVALTDETVAAWKDGERRDVHRDMMRLTLEIVGHTLFGTDVADSASQVGNTLDVAMRHFESEARGVHRFLPRWLPTPARRHFRREVAGLDSLLQRIIESHRRNGASQEETLLGRLLAARDDDGSGMTDAQVRDEAVTIFLAGHETTALALTFTFYLLSRHPEAAARLYTELDETLGGRLPELTDLPRLPFTDAVVRESMRLYPPAWTVGREPLEDVEIAGYRMPKGVQILTPQWVIQRDPRWFEEAAEFRPERWLDGLDKRLPRFAYFPFGGGPRICVGNHFAMMEADLLLATIASRWRLELVPGYELELHPSITVRPRRGMPMVVHRRALASAR